MLRRMIKFAFRSIQALNEFQTVQYLDLYGLWNYFDQRITYPFDTYQMTTVFAAFDNNTGEVLPIINLAPIEQANNLVPRHHDVPATVLGPNGTMVMARSSHVSFDRPALLMSFVVILFVVNWALTAAVVYVLILVGWGRDVSEGVLVLPISVIIMLPALRALWVDAPLFGASFQA